MAKHFVNYTATLEPVTNKVVFSGIELDHKKLVAIINQTDGIIIYATGVVGKGYLAISTIDIRLEYDISGMSDTDDIQVIYDDYGGNTINNSDPVSLPVKEYFTQSAKSVVNTNMITGIVSDWYDVSKYNHAVCHIVGSSGISAGAIIFEGTNDTSLSPNGITIPFQQIDAQTSVPNTAAVSISANTSRIYQCALPLKYFRVRISTAFTGGTISAITSFSQFQVSAAMLSSNVTGTVSANATIVGSSSGIGIGLQTFLTTEVSSSAITSSANTSAATISNFISTNFIIAVTAVSGTSPTYDISVEESPDSGTNWNVRYQFPRITTTGIYRSPQLNLNGINRTRLVQTIGGTSPSFTRSITRLNSNTQDSEIRQLVNRTIVPTTSNSVSPSLFCGSATNLQLTVVTGAATTPAVYTIDVSMDGTNWVDLSLALTGTASSSVQSSVKISSGLWARARVSTAGVTVTQDHIVLRAF